jgi:hypothetical protein
MCARPWAQSLALKEKKKNSRQLFNRSWKTCNFEILKIYLSNCPLKIVWRCYFVS